eukprot:jgi/Mesvir1/7609/Mv06340-RA.1
MKPESAEECVLMALSNNENVDPLAVGKRAATSTEEDNVLKVIKSEPLLRVKRLSENAVIPSRGSKHAAGYDLSSAHDCVIPARGKGIAKTDLAISIPEGTYARIAPRSGLAWKNHIDLGAGVVDYDYRGNIGVVMFNHSETDFVVRKGDRVAQLILEKIMTPDVLEVADLDDTERGEGGFGSTGVSNALPPPTA